MSMKLLRGFVFSTITLAALLPFLALVLLGL